MKVSGPLSDQLYTWSDIHAEQELRHPAATPQNTFTPAPPFGSRAARVAHRALQTLRQTGLQVRQRPRSRPQVLPLSQSHRCAATDGLRASGHSDPSGRVSGQLPAHPRGPRRALCDQLRTAPPPRGVLSHAGERRPHGAHRDPRSFPCCHPHRQHARSLARSRDPILCERGGQR